MPKLFAYFMYVAANIFYLYDGHRKAKTAAHAFGSMQMFQQ